MKKLNCFSTLEAAIKDAQNSFFRQSIRIFNGLPDDWQRAFAKAMRTSRAQAWH